MNFTQAYSLKSLFSSGAYSDVSIVLPDNTIFLGHKAILCSQAGYFASLYHMLPDTKRIDLSHEEFVTADLLKVLEFLYTGIIEIPLRKEDQTCFAYWSSLSNLLIIADFLVIPAIEEFFVGEARRFNLPLIFYSAHPALLSCMERHWNPQYRIAYSTLKQYEDEYHQISAGCMQFLYTHTVTNAEICQDFLVFYHAWRRVTGETIPGLSNVLATSKLSPNDQSWVPGICEVRLGLFNPALKVSQLRGISLLVSLDSIDPTVAEFTPDSLVRICQEAKLESFIAPYTYFNDTKMAEAFAERWSKLAKELSLPLQPSEEWLDEFIFSFGSDRFEVLKAWTSLMESFTVA